MAGEKKRELSGVQRIHPNDAQPLSRLRSYRLQILSLVLHAALAAGGSGPEKSF